MTIRLKKDLLRYWDEEKECFVHPSGDYTIMIGASSADIRLQKGFFYNSKVWQLDLSYEGDKKSRPAFTSKTGKRQNL